MQPRLKCGSSFNSTKRSGDKSAAAAASFLNLWFNYTPPYVVNFPPPSGAAAADPEAAAAAVPLLRCGDMSLEAASPPSPAPAPAKRQRSKRARPPKRTNQATPAQAMAVNAPPKKEPARPDESEPYVTGACGMSGAVDRQTWAAEHVSSAPQVPHEPPQPSSPQSLHGADEGEEEAGTEA